MLISHLHSWYCLLKSTKSVLLATIICSSDFFCRGKKAAVKDGLEKALSRCRAEKLPHPHEKKEMGMAYTAARLRVL